MAIRFSLGSRELLMTALLAVASHASLAFETTYTGAFNDDSVFFDKVDYYTFFGRYAPLPEQGSQVSSLVRSFVSRKGRLQEGDGSITVNEVDPEPGESDFEGVSTTTPGGLVSMTANIGVVPAGFGAVNSRAKSDFFANHASANNIFGNYFFNDKNNGEANDDGDPSNDYFLRSETGAFGSSLWGDTWQATQNATVGLNFALDGKVHLSNLCANTFCGVIFPSGTNASDPLFRYFSFTANMAVFDLDTLVPCGHDDCDGEEDAPMTVAAFGLRGGSSFAEDRDVVLGGDTLVIDLTGKLDFEIIAGHRYYVASQIEVSSLNGVTVDFFNTFGVSSVEAPAGSFISDAVLNKGANLNVSAVPLPGAAYLLLGGLGTLLARRRRSPRLSGSVAS